MIYINYLYMKGGNSMYQNNGIVLYGNSYAQYEWKHFLEWAAKVTERSDPYLSIVLDFMGLQLVDNWIEDIQKRCSIINKYMKMYERR